MTSAKGLSIQVFGWILCVAFLLSCHSSNKVVSTYGKRKYMKGWFWNKRKSADTKATKGKDTTLTHKYTSVRDAEKKDSTSSSVTAPAKEEAQGHPKHSRRWKRDSAKMMAKNSTPEIAQKDETSKTKTKAPPEPSDHIIIRLLVLIAVLTALAAFVTGLITPIVIWKITQNFLIIAGVIFSFIALALSVNSTLEVKSASKTVDKRYNLGKPAWVLSLWGAFPMALLYTVVKTSLISNLLFIEIATMGLFVSGICVLLSLIFAGKALFVQDRHKGKAVIALLIDALLITAGVLLFV